MSLLGLSLVPVVALGLGQSGVEYGPVLPSGEFASAVQPEDVAEVDEDDLEESESESESESEAEVVAEPAAAPAAPADDVAAEGTPKKFNEWGLMLSAGPSFMVGPNWSATGAIMRLGLMKHWWRNHFMIASGPSVSYWFAQDKVAQDKIHLATFNGELMMGGGVAEKFAVYGHLVLGLGYLQAHDGATNTTIKFVGGKSGAGVGAKYYIIPKLSVGALADFNFLGGLAVDAMVTLSFNFGRTAKT